MRPTIAAAFAGTACAAVALATAQLAAAAVAPGSAPVAAIGAAVVDAVPEPVKEFAIRTFGEYDKLALLAGIGTALAVLAAATGVAARRRPWIGYAVLALLGGAGAAAALARPAASPSWAVPSLVGAACGAGVLALLLRERLEGPAAPGRAVDRRGVLIALGGAGLAGAAGWRLTGTSDLEDARNAIDLPAPVDVGPAGAGLDDAADIDGLTPYLTPNGDFYRVDTALVLPRVLPEDYTLRITGRVANPLELSYRDLLDRGLVEREITISCVSNEVGGNLAGNARWLGVPLADLLAEAGPEPGADQVVSRSADGWTAGTPTEACTDGRDALVAVGMNGRPLPLEHGFPVRMIVPGLYGYVSATKWLTEIELSSFADFDAYWVRRDWKAQAPIKTFSRIDTPKPLATVAAGQVTVAGVAWAQQRGVARVEVRVDDGPWSEAELAPVIGDDTWRQWKWTWEAASGRRTLEVRATDGDGAVQTEERVTPFPDGATGWHSIVLNAE
ncbi:molybdopterin-dependent oxidoreductase [Glycomyces sp. NPDC047010]|uniref:molybdopterin-dependent oxidoreductase n=1 Tax=Glycomyces sp. NPDC047010 TaxID=3155023 RepID=UPI0033DE49F0